MDWFLIVLMLLIAAGINWGIRFFFNRKYREIGEVTCRWYTGPAVSGIIILGSYTLTIFYLYCTSFIMNYLLLFLFGLIMLGFYYFFGRAAIGINGVFTNGRSIPWKAIYDYQLSGIWGNRLRWQFRWRESSAPAGDRSTTMIIPTSHRTKAEEVIRTTLQNKSDDIKE